MNPFKGVYAAPMTRSPWGGDPQIDILHLLVLYIGVLGNATAMINSPGMDKALLKLRVWQHPTTNHIDHGPLEASSYIPLSGVFMGHDWYGTPNVCLLLLLNCLYQEVYPTLT